MPEIRTATVVSVETLPGFSTLVAEAATGALPGQWGAFWTDLPNPAKPGEVLKRAWSFAEIGETRFRLFVATVGPGTEWLAARRPGDTLRYTGPWGSRFRLDDGDGLAAFYAAGSGISPVGAMVDACVARGRPARLLWETRAPAMHDRLLRWRGAGVEVVVGPRLAPTGPGTWWFAGDGGRLDEVVGDAPPERVERFYSPSLTPGSPLRGTARGPVGPPAPGPLAPGASPAPPLASIGVVAIIGAGPGDPALLTVRGRQLLDEAEVVVHDALVSEEILRTVRAERIDVGKRRGKHLADQEEINGLLVRLAREGRRVVRLKGGDPLLFGRGGEEMQALKDAGIAYVVVPGVSSALAGPAMAGIPVTHREHAAAVTVVTGHECDALVRDPLRWRAMAETGHTLVILMGLTHLASVVERLVAAGRPADTPAAVVQEATTPRERAVVGTLADIAGRVERAGIRAPAVVVVGPVVALAKELAWRT